MPCHSAMIEKPVTLTMDVTVEKALKALKKSKTPYAVIVDDDGAVEGLFSPEILMRNLLPVSVSVSGGVAVDMNIRAAPGVAKRLRKVMPLAVSNIMERKLSFIRPETPTWEGVNLMIAQGEPLIVVEAEELKFIGMITAGSILSDIEALDSDEKR